jgi:aryl-alcohol dehydrogenase-like predicted oxidoreductase
LGHDYSGLLESAATSGVGVMAMRALAAGLLAREPHPLSGRQLPSERNPVADAQDRQAVETITALKTVAEQFGFESTAELSFTYSLFRRTGEVRNRTIETFGVCPANLGKDFVRPATNLTVEKLA